LRYERPVYSLIVRLVRDSAMAEDLSQDVFVKAFRALSSYDPERKFSSWLFKIAHNTTLDQLRKRTLDTEPLETEGEEGLDSLRTVADPSAATPLAQLERSELAAGIEKAIARLRPEYREVMLLRFREGLAYEEISQITDLPLGTVKTHVHRARKEMVAFLTAAGWTPQG
jgi:RNA polymerase sigma-70 factor (ECF subfamily)